MEQIRKLSVSKTYWATNTGLFLSAITHLFFLYLFYINDVTPLFYLNIFSVLIFTGLLYLVVTRKLITLAIIGACVELTIHQIASVAFLGWDYGFQYYLLAIPAIILLGTYNKLYLPITFTLLTILLLGSLKLMSIGNTPPYSMESIKDILYIFNLSVVTLTTSIFTGLFGFNSQKNEEKLIKAQKELHNAVNIDPLTGLRNRSSMLNEIHNLRSNALGGLQQNYVVAFIDIENLKQVNSDHGQSAGDQYLIEIADMIKHTVREEDIVGRWSGRRMMVLLPKLTLNQAQRLLSQVKVKLTKTVVRIDKIELNSQISMAASECSGEPLETILQEVEQNLQQAKIPPEKKLEIA